MSDDYLNELNGLLEIQRDCITDGYMRGMYNGIECARAVYTDEEPEYLDPPELGTCILYKHPIEGLHFLWVDQNVSGWDEKVINRDAPQDLVDFSQDYKRHALPFQEWGGKIRAGARLVNCAWVPEAILWQASA